jgi:exodeoxyribonuclease VII large subunit
MVNDFVSATEEAWSAIAGQSLTMLQAADHDLASAATRVRSLVGAAVATAQSRLDVARDRIRRRPSDILKSAAKTIDAAADRVRLLDPVNAMARGWSIVRDARGRTVTSVTQLAVHDVVMAQFADGTLQAEVREVVQQGSTKGKQ